MSVSFDRWRLPQRLQLEADLRLLRRAHVARRSVLDGDTFQTGGTSIRLHGIDARS
jgi:endonuclease YncB( thermonuclease family)